MQKENRIKIYHNPREHQNYSFDYNYDDDPEILYQPCFEVGKNVQLKEIPTSGEEYLLSVIAERKNIPRVTKCDIDLTQFKDKQSIFVEEIPLTPPPIWAKQDEEWYTILLHDFTDIRNTIAEARLNIHNLKFNIERANVGWETFKCWCVFFRIKQPLLSCMLGLNQRQVDKGLQSLTRLLERIPAGEHLDHKTGAWIFSFLACLELPLLADTYSTMRTLVRLCAKKRCELDPNTEGEAIMSNSYNIFICIVSLYFGQTDLAD